jgi:ABC-type multidrug transport system permease subunit
MPYFWGRSLANFPFEIIYGSIPCIMIFWGCGLNNNDTLNFPTLLLISNTLYFCAISYGLFYSTAIPKLETAMAMVPVLIIPFMMLSGFFIDLNEVPKVFIPF